MDSVSFKARININQLKLNESLVCDAVLRKSSNQNSLNTTLKKVQELSKMKEKSIVNIEPRLDKNQLNLITTVKNKSGEIDTVVWERSGRKIAKDENFATRFVKNIARAITNVDITAKSMKQIDKTIKQSKTLKDNNFTKKLPYYMIESLNKGHNPTKRINSILKQIEKQYPNEENIISIVSERNSALKNPKTLNSTTYFCVKNSQGDKRIGIHTLLKDSVENLFV